MGGRAGRGEGEGWPGRQGRPGCSYEHLRPPVCHLPAFHLPLSIPPPAGEARTDAFVEANGGGEAAFDHLVEPASLILATLLKVRLCMCGWGGREGATRPHSTTSWAGLADLHHIARGRDVHVCVGRG